MKVLKAFEALTMGITRYTDTFDVTFKRRQWPEVLLTRRKDLNEYLKLRYSDCNRFLPVNMKAFIKLNGRSVLFCSSSIARNGNVLQLLLQIRSAVNSLCYSMKTEQQGTNRRKVQSCVPTTVIGVCNCIIYKDMSRLLNASDYISFLACDTS